MRFMPMLTLWILLSMAGPAGVAERTKARLFLSASEARPGETVAAGVLHKMPPGWHTYWRNAGDSGTPTTVE